NYLFLDIETAPIKINDENIKEYLMDKKISKERRSMDPNYSKIITIGLKSNDKLELFYGDNEKELLVKFWDLVNKDVIIVTHNGYGFDIPFLLIRSIVNNVLPKNINLNPWQMLNSNHFDTMLFFSQHSNFTNPRLDILAKLNNINTPEERILGNEVEKFYKQGNWEKIKERCTQDIELLEKVFNKLCKNYIENYKR
ncbi:MAG: ribonuclease H-like domain-containing protein, partial [Nanoarchaeota archaeon]